MRRSLYDVLYRFGAPWDGPPRAELVSLVESGALTPARLPPGRAIDLGCGTGANLRYLARHGFEATGVDFSRVALRVARQRAAAEHPGYSIRFVEGDLTATAIPGVEGPFDLLIDYGTLDDLDPDGRLAMARLVAGLARPGAAFLLWCYWARRADLPRISLTGPSRLIPVMVPGEEASLFGDAFAIERLPEPDPVTHTACFLMTRR
ncbi:MAG: class I SAM-dependent methyltransferase [Chloroflexota bacterium]